MLETFDDDPARSARENHTNPYVSVSLACTEDACAAARALAGKRHLLEEAPALPLPGCTAGTCNCRYFRYGDRRSLLGNRRSQGREAVNSAARLRRGERRRGEDRRKLKIAFI